MCTTTEKRKIAQELLPLYNTWHHEAVKAYDSPEALAAEQRLWHAVHRYPEAGLPVKITASIGRWVARVLKMSTHHKQGVI